MRIDRVRGNGLNVESVWWCGVIRVWSTGVIRSFWVVEGVEEKDGERSDDAFAGNSGHRTH